MPKRLAQTFLIIGILMCTMMIARPLSATPPTVIDENTLADIEVAGTYPVRISYTTPTGEVVTKIVYITVHHPKTIVDEETREGIDASDAEVPHGMVQTLTNQDLINLTKAHAWNINNGAPVAIQVESLQLINAELGIYEVTFTTTKGSSITVKILETAEIMFQQQETYLNLTTISGNSFLFENLLLLIIAIPIILLFFNYLQMKKEIRETQAILYQKEQQ